MQALARRKLSPHGKSKSDKVMLVNNGTGITKQSKKAYLVSRSVPHQKLIIGNVKMTAKW